MYFGRTLCCGCNEIYSQQKRHIFHICLFFLCGHVSHFIESGGREGGWDGERGRGAGGGIGRDTDKVKDRKNRNRTDTKDTDTRHTDTQTHRHEAIRTATQPLTHRHTDTERHKPETAGRPHLTKRHQHSHLMPACATPISGKRLHFIDNEPLREGRYADTDMAV